MDDGPTEWDSSCPKIAFELMDRDGDGIISPPEFKACLKATGTKLMTANPDDQEIRDFLGMISSDHRVTLSAFEEALENPGTRFLKRMAEKMLAQAGKLKRAKNGSVEIGSSVRRTTETEDRFAFHSPSSPAVKVPSLSDAPASQALPPPREAPAAAKGGALNEVTTAALNRGTPASRAKKAMLPVTPNTAARVKTKNARLRAQLDGQMADKQARRQSMLSQEEAAAKADEERLRRERLELQQRYEAELARERAEQERQRQKNAPPAVEVKAKASVQADGVLPVFELPAASPMAKKHGGGGGGAGIAATDQQDARDSTASSRAGSFAEDNSLSVDTSPPQPRAGGGAPGGCCIVS